VPVAGASLDDWARFDVERRVTSFSAADTSIPPQEAVTILLPLKE